LPRLIGARRTAGDNQSSDEQCSDREPVSRAWSCGEGRQTAALPRARGSDRDHQAAPNIVIEAALGACGGVVVVAHGDGKNHDRNSASADQKIRHIVRLDRRADLRPSAPASDRLAAGFAGPATAGLNAIDNIVATASILVTRIEYLLACDWGKATISSGLAQFRSTAETITRTRDRAALAAL